MGHPPATHCRSGRGWHTVGTQGRVNRRRAAAGAKGQITSHEIVATLERGRKAVLAPTPGTEQLSARPRLTRHQTDWPVHLSAALANGGRLWKQARPRRTTRSSSAIWMACPTGQSPTVATRQTGATMIRLIRETVAGRCGQPTANSLRARPSGTVESSG